MSLLTICQNAADELQLPRPASIIGNSNTDPRRLLRYANRVGERLMKTCVWQRLRKERTFAATAAIQQAAWAPSDPADFDRFIPETFWDRTNGNLISGPVDGVRWQGRAATGSADALRVFAYRGGELLVRPAPTGAETYAFEYVSNQWCEGDGGTGRTAGA